MSRAYCHLCHEMERALAPLIDEYAIELDVVDVDSDLEFEAQYNEWVPVLLHDGSELCHHFLDIAKVRDYLDKIR